MAGKLQGFIDGTGTGSATASNKAGHPFDKQSQAYWEGRKQRIDGGSNVNPHAVGSEYHEAHDAGYTLQPFGSATKFQCAE